MDTPPDSTVILLASKRMMTSLFQLMLVLAPILLLPLLKILDQWTPMPLLSMDPTPGYNVLAPSHPVTVGTAKDLPVKGSREAPTKFTGKYTQ
ncbi:hypothetical protein BDP27DRAFT_1455739, partial [Rhodocollybia butyracea]